MAARRWDRLSEGSRRREAPRAAVVFLHAVSSPPPHATRIAPLLLPPRTPRPSTIALCFPPLSPPSRPCFSGAASTRQLIFSSFERRAPGPGPIPGPLALPSPFPDFPGGGPLKAGSAVAPAPLLAAPAAPTRSCVLVRAGSFFHEARTPRDARRASPAAPTTPWPLLAGGPRTTPHHTPSPITHTPLSIHLHPHNSLPLSPPRLSSPHPPPAPHKSPPVVVPRVWGGVVASLCLI